MWIVGLILLVTSGGLGIGYGAQQKRLAALKRADSNSIATVQSIAQEVGSLNYITGIRGTIRCDQPLISELAQEPCVYYEMKVTRQYEEIRWRSDSKGKRTRETVRGSSVEATNQRHIPFGIEDAGGQIRVRPDGAEFICETFLSRFEPAGSEDRSLTLGGLTLRLGGDLGSRRTVGYQFEEKGIPLGREVYVLGEVVSTDGRLQMQCPTQGRFVISIKPVEELIRSGQSVATGLIWGSLSTGVAGAVVLLLDVL